jgi:hypothetical protein
MASLRTWRTATATLLLVMLATTSTTAAAEATTTSGHQPRARYCKQVDAYRIKTCAEALLPAGPLGRQLRWELDQLAGEATTLTEAEVQAHFSAEFLTVMMPPEVVVQFFQQNLAERGPSPSSASPTPHGPARPWPCSRRQPASGARCQSGSPAAVRP